MHPWIYLLLDRLFGFIVYIENHFFDSTGVSIILQVIDSDEEIGIEDEERGSIK